MSGDAGIVIVGGGVAAVECATTLRTLGCREHITLIGAEPDLPYDRTLVSKDLLAGEPPEDHEILLEVPAVYEELGLELILDSEVIGVDVERRQVFLSRGYARGYRALVAVTGAEAVVPTTIDPAAVHQLRTLRDARRLRAELAKAASLTVIGGGFIGCEVASAAAARGVDVTIVEAAPALLGHALGPDGSRWLEEFHKRHGVNVHTACTVVGIDASAGRVILDSGVSIVSDVVVVAVGVRPSTEWLLPDGGAISTDLCGRTSWPGVWAGGDCAEWVDPVTGGVSRCGHWNTALRQARAIGYSILDLPRPPRSVPFFWSDQHDVKLQVVGWPECAEAAVLEAADHQTLVIEFRRDGRVIGLAAAGAASRVAEARSALSTQSHSIA